MRTQITITVDELVAVIAALRVVTPSGGGSCSRSLSAKLTGSIPSEVTETEYEHRLGAMEEAFRHNVISEYVEAVGDNHPELARLVTEQMREWPRTTVDV